MLLLLSIIQIILVFCLVGLIVFQDNKSEGGMFNNMSSLSPGNMKESSSIPNTISVVALLFMINTIVLSRLYMNNDNSSLLSPKNIIQENTSYEDKLLDFNSEGLNMPDREIDESQELNADKSKNLNKLDGDLELNKEKNE